MAELTLKDRWEFIKEFFDYLPTDGQKAIENMRSRWYSKVSIEQTELIMKELNCDDPIDIFIDITEGNIEIEIDAFTRLNGLDFLQKEFDTMFLEIIENLKIMDAMEKYNKVSLKNKKGYQITAWKSKNDDEEFQVNFYGKHKRKQ